MPHLFSTRGGGRACETVSRFCVGLNRYIKPLQAHLTRPGGGGWLYFGRRAPHFCQRGVQPSNQFDVVAPLFIQNAIGESRRVLGEESLAARRSAPRVGRVLNTGRGAVWWHHLRVGRRHAATPGSSLSAAAATRRSGGGAAALGVASLSGRSLSADGAVATVAIK